jgi:hypothetical protein
MWMWAGIALAALLASEPAADAQPQASLCPSPAEVEAELARLGAIGVAPPNIEVIGDRMRVVLHGHDGAPVGSREIEAPSTCRERATVAAVLVATWMGIWPESPRPASPSPTAPTPRPAATSHVPAQLGLAVLGVHDGNAAALGIAVEARRQLVGPLYGWAGLGATTERDRTVGPAVAGYMRPAIELGPAFRIGRSRVQADLAASFRLGILFLRGKGLPVTHQKTHVAPGAAANLRLVLAGERSSPFVVVGASTWFASQELRVDENDTWTADLPRWDVTAGLGLFWSP